MLLILVYSEAIKNALMRIVSQGISHGQLDDAEVVLSCLRALHPELTDLDTLEAWLTMKREFWQDAIRILRNIDLAADNDGMNRALLAYCQFTQEDDEWRFNANQVLANSNNKAAIDLVKVLMGDKSEDRPEEDESISSNDHSAYLHDSMMNANMYIRV
jgi:type III secretion system HrpB1/HrpK family protein